VLLVTALGAAVLALVAAIVGVPLGMGAYRVMMRAVGTGSGIGPTLGAPPPWWLLALLFPMTIAVGSGIGAAVSRHAASAEVSDLVRYE
jgi:putative ABC transport system permease protein